MDLNLKGKKVLVTGATKGIGFGIAQALLNESCQVLINSRHEFKVDSLNIRSSDHLSHVCADVTTPEGISKIQDAIHSVFSDKLDLLVCNVGSGKSVAPGTEKTQDWHSSFAMNFFSTTNVIEALRSKLTLQSGSILCISSICGQEQLGAPLTYTAAKAALNSYVVGLSRVLGKNGQRINAIAPGNILFPGSVWEQKMKDNPKAVNEMLSKDVALNKFGTPDDIADIALFLLSERAKFITGSIVVVDGGQVRSW